jgi:cytochrome c-type biogenesis protein CcsB
MSPRTRVTIVAALLIAALSALIVGRMSNRPPKVEPSAFAQEVDLSPIAESAVHARGRLKSFHSFADLMVRAISGPHDLFGQSPDFTYFDLMLRPERYADEDVLFIKNKGVRAQLAQALREREDYPPERIAVFMRVGLVSPAVVTTDPKVRAVLARMGRDAMRTAKFVDQLNNALAARTPSVLKDNLRLIPPPGATDQKTPWLAMLAIEGDALAQAPMDDAHSGIGADAMPGVLPGLDPNLSADLSAAWSRFRLAWLSEDAAGVNQAASTLASLLPQVNPDLYPAQRRLALESMYLDWNNFTWVWIVYLFSIVFLVMAVAYKWRTARTIGLGFFFLAFALHTLAIFLRWYIAGRWPNSNMFEAVTTAAWFGGAGAILLELIARRAPMRNLFFLGSAVSSMTALMAADFMPLSLTPTIGNMMPILNDVWLYIHTNVIIFSYVLIAMAAVTAILYLLYRLGGGTPDFARAGGAGALLSMNDAAAKSDQPGAGPGAGAGAIRKTSAGEVFDGATMVLLELAFILLWAGTIMGAIWADHSWGRPWGWDPKEVFALNTFIIFVVLVHVRLKVKDKGLWTAWLAIIGCAVMIFNWTVINFVISGLHSYA